MFVFLFVNRRQHDGKSVSATQADLPSVHRERDGRVAAQGFGIGAGFVGLIHDALRLGGVDSRELRMQIHRQAVAALVILDQAHQCPHGGILDRSAEFLGRIA